MNFDTLALLALVLSAIPCGLFLLNLLVYRPLGNQLSPNVDAISVLIPARNEEMNIRATLAAILANHGVEFEVIVLDDHSTDGTSGVVSTFATHDSRVRLESAPPLPAGWCGKQHACHVLARFARNPLLLFIDADVRLAPDALSRIAQFMARSNAALVSGVPRQELGTFSERLLLPLIHFILLGFLPMHAMRRTRRPAMSAGCGQLFVARRHAYENCGGHAMLRDSLHDGIKLPRVFRQAGFRTDLFDATDLATCRMYHANGDAWRGLGKNATEGLAAPGTILPMTVLLLGGQVLPFILLLLAARLTSTGLMLSGAAVTMAWLPRLISARLFHQPFTGALLHPLGVIALLAIQWHALIRSFAGKPSVWKGRSYAVLKPSKLSMKIAKGTLAIAAALLVAGGVEAKEVLPPSTKAPAQIELRDQFDAPQRLTFPTTNVVVLTIADRKGAEQIEGWVAALRARYSGRLELRGLADVRGVPGLLRGKVRKSFQDARRYPVMMDWSGKVCAEFGFQPGVANVFVIARDGSIEARAVGPAREPALKELSSAIDAALMKSALNQSNATSQLRAPGLR